MGATHLEDLKWIVTTEMLVAYEAVGEPLASRRMILFVVRSTLSIVAKALEKVGKFHIVYSSDCSHDGVILPTCFFKIPTPQRVIVPITPYATLTFCYAQTCRQIAISYFFLRIVKPSLPSISHISYIPIHL